MIFFLKNINHVLINSFHSKRKKKRFNNNIFGIKDGSLHSVNLSRATDAIRRQIIAFNLHLRRTKMFCLFNKFVLFNNHNQPLKCAFLIWRSRRKMNRNKNLLILYYLWKSNKLLSFPCIFFSTLFQSKFEIFLLCFTLWNQLHHFKQWV